MAQKSKQVSRKEFDELSSGVSRILDLMEKQAAPAKATAPVVATTIPPVAVPTATPIATAAQEKEIKKAGPTSNSVPVPPEWVEKAEEILGDHLDHCELFYPRRGGQIFTIVIKKEKTNAPQAYMDFYKEDRRSKDIGNEGIEGAEAWCKLVKSNIARTLNQSINR